MRRSRLTFALLVAVAGIAAALYATASSGTPFRLTGGPIPRVAAEACNASVTPVGHTKSVNNTRRIAAGLWIGGVVVDQGYGATKTVIESIRRGRTTLRGWRCSDGRPLRFWFRNADLPWSGRGSQEELATTGTRSLPFRPTPLSGRYWFTVGAILFSSPGKWVVEAREGGHILGTALFDFPR